MADLCQAIVKEYFFLQQNLEGYNSQFIELKSWSVSIGIAAIIAAYTKPVAGVAGRIGVIIAALAAVPFWLTETFWKLFQKAHEQRIQDIEGYLSKLSKAGQLGGPDTACQGFQPLQIWSSWDKEFQAGLVGDWFAVAFDAHVLLPHAFLLVLGLTLACVRPPSAA